MPRLPTVAVVRARDGFEARVVAARLGADGIVTQLRGGFDSPYPVGEVDVLVAEEDLDVARELLLADEVEAAFENGVFDDVTDEPIRRNRLRLWVAVTVSALLIVADIAVLAFRW